MINECKFYIFQERSRLNVSLTGAIAASPTPAIGKSTPTSTHRISPTTARSVGATRATRTPAPSGSTWRCTVSLPHPRGSSNRRPPPRRRAPRPRSSRRAAGSVAPCPQPLACPATHRPIWASGTCARRRGVCPHRRVTSHPPWTVVTVTPTSPWVPGYHQVAATLRQTIEIILTWTKTHNISTDSAKKTTIFGWCMINAKYYGYQMKTCTLHCHPCTSPCWRKTPTRLCSPPENADIKPLFVVWGHEERHPRTFTRQIYFVLYNLLCFNL